MVDIFFSVFFIELEIYCQNRFQKLRLSFLLTEKYIFAKNYLIRSKTSTCKKNQIKLDWFQKNKENDFNGACLRTIG